MLVETCTYSEQGNSGSRVHPVMTIVDLVGSVSFLSAGVRELCLAIGEQNKTTKLDPRLLN